jgi:hypothetical protein
MEDDWAKSFPVSKICKLGYFKNYHVRLEVYTECLGWIILEATDKYGFSIIENPHWMPKPFITRTYDYPHIKTDKKKVLDSYFNQSKCV